MKLAEIAYLEKLRLPLKLNALDGLAVVQFKCIRRHTHGFCFIPVFNNLGEVLHSLFGSFGYNRPSLSPNLAILLVRRNIASRRPTMMKVFV